MSYRFDGTWIVEVRVPLSSSTQALYPAVRCEVAWVPTVKRYRVVMGLVLPGVERETLIARTHIRRWLGDRRARYLGTPHERRLQ